MRFDFLIFDLDGTLSDPKLGVVRCMNYALSSFDYAPRGEDEIAQYIGPPLEETIQKLTGSQDEQHIDEMIVRYRERYFEIGYTENELYPNIEEMLSVLKNNNLAMGVCTSKHQTAAEKILERFEITKYFEFIDGPTEKTIKAKQLEKLLGANTISKNSIMIGDRSVDLIAAKSNGLAKAGVLWGYGTSDELNAEDPEYVFSSPRELVETFTAD
ncbi:MAG: HAD hydrolase-like protein [Pseudomonadales bacterium]|nr:HAD hydrolase-like protein [Pseudomonadales bacterium]